MSPPSLFCPLAGAVDYCRVLRVAVLLQESKRTGVYRQRRAVQGEGLSRYPLAIHACASGLCHAVQYFSKGKMPWAAFMFSVVFFCNFLSQADLFFIPSCLLEIRDVLLNWMINSCSAEHDAGLNEDLQFLMSDTASAWTEPLLSGFLIRVAPSVLTSQQRKTNWSVAVDF